jgi:50S ribosomal subunit-associated GTPase HflX
LLELIEQRLAAAALTFEIKLSAEDGQDLSWLYSRGEVLARTDDDQGMVRLAVRFDPAVAPLAQSRFGDRLKSIDQGLRAAAE